MLKVVTTGKILFIINKYSGMGIYTAIERRIKDVCAENGTEYTITYTQRRGHAIALAREGSDQGFKIVVAVGGDGTINEVAQGLLNTETLMGIVPRGSGNGLARHLGIPVNPGEAIDILFSDSMIRMDTMFINNKLSLNVSGIGFDGHIANLFADKKIRGLLGYIRLSVVEFFNFPEFDAMFDINEKKFSQKSFIIALANSSQYGNNIKIAPLASVCDGLLNISVIKKVPFYKLGFIYSFLRGRLKKSKWCLMSEGSEVQIKTRMPIPYHIDGEPCGVDDSFHIQLKPASLSIIVPKAE
jgi:YegS/Rv2252/BmrU family lipid kinase